MKNVFKALILASVVTSVYAEDGSYNGTVDMNMPSPTVVNVERIVAERFLKDRNDSAVGGFRIITDTLDSAIELKGRRD
ncbi:hypothetical protein [Vibrio sagamiensis]|uniref:Uncharacterized protein n=1 Tax=Vibrio sagamiensis NBRC 104589 TaxID=1219064 RepID=A0A511QIX9_9VIBR|nr:hypothetical protein [Vibrio sagamiensis]PNQ60273.1 hypothetical protein C1141_11965 [Vibrio agarivorans]GEM77284.1 hypothetical protein VSA01S_33960 [Vibrio sagamiensis NBRC 104589]